MAIGYQAAKRTTSPQPAQLTSLCSAAALPESHLGTPVAPDELTPARQPRLQLERGPHREDVPTFDQPMWADHAS